MFAMSDRTKESVRWWVDVVWKVGTPLGLAALFYLKSQFASVDEMKAAEDRLTKIETAIQLLIKDNEQDQRQDQTLRDIENRLRLVERARP
jgi:hypothetical protein